MNIQENSLIIKNIVAYYEPFSIKEVFHNKLNRVVHYAVFIDNDPFKRELGFDKILFNKDDFEVNMDINQANSELIKKQDLYFLTKLAIIIDKKIRRHESSLQNLKNILQEIIDKGDIENQTSVGNAVKMDILRISDRIEFIKASEEKLKTNYQLYNCITKSNNITH